MGENPLEDARNYIRQGLGALMELDDQKKRSRENVIQDFIDTLEGLPDDNDRLDVMARVYDRFCRDCGGKQPLHGSCSCWNDD